jgi:hypothetical protein
MLSPFVAPAVIADRLASAERTRSRKRLAASARPARAEGRPFHPAAPAWARRRWRRPAARPAD